MSRITIGAFEKLKKNIYLLFKKFYTILKNITLEACGSLIYNRLCRKIQ